MRKQTKYLGISTGCYAERAIDIVVEAKSITGPELAAKLGFSVYEMSNLRRAEQLGYLKKGKSDKPGAGNVNVYTVGEHLPAPGEERKSVPHILLEHIAANGKLTSIALAKLADMTPGAVSGCLNHYTKNGVLKMRFVPSEGLTHRKQISEYYGANLPLYLENHAQIGGRRAPGAKPASSADQKNIVPPREAPVFRPLNLSRLGSVPQRDGAWDFRSIPSHFSEGTR